MSAMLQVLALWIPVSCVICPFFTWPFFRAERRVQQEPEAVSRDGTVVSLNKWRFQKS